MDKKPEIFIGDLTHKASVEIFKQIDEIEKYHSPSQPILVHINSHGGSVHEMSMIYNRLKSLQNPIITYTSSSAMSAGAILLSTLAAKGSRFAAPNAVIMVHEIQAGAGGDIKDMEDRMKNLKKINTHWMNVLAKSMGLKSSRDIRNLIQSHAIGQDVFLSAKEAQTLGLVDEIAILRAVPIQAWQFERVKDV